MLLGLDVGGTFTDAVIIDGNRVAATAKRRTTKDNLMNGIGEALDLILKDVRPEHIEQVTLSTTIVTNTVVEERETQTDLYVVTGPGMNVDHSFPVESVYLNGYTDHRGIVVESTSSDEVDRAVQKQLESRSHERPAAVSAKFGVRNPREEQRIASELSRYYDVVTGASRLSGALNFPRRTVSAYFNSAVTPVFRAFKSSVEEALKSRRIDAPLYILKADGGSLPIRAIAETPVETVFTGPAASVLGLYALSCIGEEPTVALDIGGTTTDISLWRKGKPVMAKGGVSIRQYPSAVRAFAVTSVGIGGESLIRNVDGIITVGPERLGPSAALGGDAPTLGDALITAGSADYGNITAAREAIASLNPSVSPDVVAEQCIQVALETIKEGIDRVIREENRKPVYVVADIVNPDLFVPARLVAVGGTASALGGHIEAYMQIPLTIPRDAAVANAIGAAMALHTAGLTVHVDTKRRTLAVPELGIYETGCLLRHSDEVVAKACTMLTEEAERLGISASAGTEVVSLEDFPVVDGWQAGERLITVKVQLKAGVSGYVE